jgi:hypothetical protein
MQWKITIEGVDEFGMVHCAEMEFDVPPILLPVKVES